MKRMKSLLPLTALATLLVSACVTKSGTEKSTGTSASQQSGTPGQPSKTQTPAKQTPAASKSTDAPAKTTKEATTKAPAKTTPAKPKTEPAKPAAPAKTSTPAPEPAKPQASTEPVKPKTTTPKPATPAKPKPAEEPKAKPADPKQPIAAPAKPVNPVVPAPAAPKATASTPSESLYYWRGPTWNGVLPFKNLPEAWEPGGTNDLFTHEIQGGGVPVIAGDRMYHFGYYGVGPELQEAIVCMHPVTGKVIWEKRYSDFLSDTVYNRYGIGAPAIDPETGNVYFHTSSGLLLGFDRDGKELWSHSLMEEFSRLTFPNGRTGGPAIDGDLVIIQCISANWGANGPARNRFYAFDKTTGELVWFATPGVAPKDSSFSPLHFDDLPDGRRVFYTGTGCGNVVCIDARTGDSLWRYQLSYGGVNSGVVLHGKDTLIAIHGKENVDKSSIGRMVSIKKPLSIPADAELPVVLTDESINWKQDYEAFTSTPCIVGDRVYQTVKTGELLCINAKDGKTIWQMKLGHDQLHASPIYADGKIYVGMHTSEFYIIRPEADKGVILNKVELDGAIFAQPSACQGRVYIQTKKKLYAFGSKAAPKPWKPEPAKKEVGKGAPASIQVVPAEFALAPGQTIKLKAYFLDRTGRRIGPAENLTWEKFIPPTAKVKAKVDATLGADGTLTAAKDAKLSAGAIRASKDNVSGVSRGRVVPDLPYAEDFENGYELNQTNTEGEKFAYTPLPWLGARLRWQVLQHEGTKVIGNTLDHVLFQRSMNFLGRPDMKDYIVEADVMTDGNRRVMSTVGLINQRYNISLIGNHQKLEIVSNYDRFKHSVPFQVTPKTWYHLKTQVDTFQDGSGIIRAKAWKKGEAEPAEWTIEAPHDNVHKNGSPGIFAFSPQSQKRVYIDNLKVTPRK
jgi:outer membrane protein assembly factor BamB